MMKRSNTMISLLLVILFIAAISETALAQAPIRTAGIGFRGSYWRMNHQKSQVIISTRDQLTDVNVGGGGGWIYFISRMNDYNFLEFSLGIVGKVNSKTEYFDGKDVNVTAITPVVLGLRQNLFHPRTQSALQPYLAFGAGAYWISDIQVHERNYVDEEVVIASDLKPGGYLGGGMNFMFCSWFGISFDVKYHFVDFNVNHDYSGFDYGLGILFTWGNYKSTRERSQISF